MRRLAARARLLTPRAPRGDRGGCGTGGLVAVRLCLPQDSLGHVGRAVVAAHVGRAHLAFRLHLEDGGLNGVGVRVQAGMWWGGVICVRAFTMAQRSFATLQRWLFHSPNVVEHEGRGGEHGHGVDLVLVLQLGLNLARSLRRSRGKAE